MGAILVCSERAVIMEPFFTVLKQAVRSDGTHPSQAGDSDGPDDPDGLDDSNDSTGAIGLAPQWRRSLAKVRTIFILP